MTTQNNIIDINSNSISCSDYETAPKAEDLCMFSHIIRDDTDYRKFLGTDSEEGIEQIFEDRNGHSLHEWIEGDEPLRPIIDFDLPQIKIDSFDQKPTRKEIFDLLRCSFEEVCIEIDPEWNRNTLTIATSNSPKKMSLHISTTGFRLGSIRKVSKFIDLVRGKLPDYLNDTNIVDNIAKRSGFSLRMLLSPKYDEKTGKHERVKKAIKPKPNEASIFDFMLRAPNDESPVVDSPILSVPESDNIENAKGDLGNTETNQTHLDLIDELLKKANITGYSVQWPTGKHPNTFQLNRINPSPCPLCKQEHGYEEAHDKENAYVVRNQKTYRFYCYRANQNKQAGTPHPSIKLIQDKRETESVFTYIENLLKEKNIEGFEVLFPLSKLPNVYPLNRSKPSHCPLCDETHDSGNAYVILDSKSCRYYCHNAEHNIPQGGKKPSLKLATNETIGEQEKNLRKPKKLDHARISDPNDSFVFGDLLDMCDPDKSFSRDVVYEAIQATVACVQRKERTWLVKVEDEDGGLCFDMGLKLDLGDYRINIIELDGASLKLKSLIKQANDIGLIRYRKIIFLPYSPNAIQPKTPFFNLFLGFLAKPAKNINQDIMKPIIWHVKHVICDGDEELESYIWNWWSFLVQKPNIKPRSILVLKSVLQQCGKNIIVDFIGDKVLGPNLHFATSDLSKILGKFNSPLQGKKLIVMNETGMSSGDWHKFNDHLKSLITEGKVAIERKGLETLRINDYSAYMITSNHDAPIKIDAGDSRVVCFDVSPRCRGNMEYFNSLAKILEHPDAPSTVMAYLLSRDISNWSPTKIPETKMKSETIVKQLPNPVRFIIHNIKSWSEKHIEKVIGRDLYREYVDWCIENGEDRISNNKFGTYFPPIGIIKKQARIGGKVESVYTLDKFIIMNKLRESIGSIIDNICDTDELETPTEIPIFNISEVESNTPYKLQNESTETIKNSDINQDKDNSKPEPKPTSKIVETLKIIEPEPELINNQTDSNEKISPAIYPLRAEREARLIEWAMNHGENPNEFIKITEEDRSKSIKFRDMMKTDARMCLYAVESDEDPKDYMGMTTRDRLIGEEIIRRDMEEKGITSSWLDDDEEWKKTIAILQENNMLW